jgi:hypothetical protein
VRSEKPASGMATPDLVMSRAEVERSGGANVDDVHGLLMGNDDVGSTLTWRGMRHDAQGRGPGTAQRGGARRSGRRGAVRRGMGETPRGGLG